MPELFQEMYYGPNVQNLVESDDCKVMRLSDNSGEGMMTLYHVFPGVFLMYNDFHMKECISGFQTDMDLLCIDHCREGRIEQEVGQNAFSYLEAGDLRVDRRIHHSGKVEFPLCHYHGISIGFQVETAAKEIPASMKGFSVDLYELQKKYCSDRTPYVIPGEPAIEHKYHIHQTVKDFSGLTSSIQFIKGILHIVVFSVAEILHAFTFCFLLIWHQASLSFMASDFFLSYSQS